MLYYSQRNKLCRHLLAGGALFAAGLGMFSCSDTYDLDSKQPVGADGKALNSLYGYLEEQGNCNTYLQLIKDMGLDETLSKTGSMTMFVADDDAFAEFFKSNKWGVTSYSKLSDAQKKLLLNCSMVGNPLTTTMLSNATAEAEGAPVRGEVCRRMSQVDILDSVPVVSSQDQILPDNDFLTSFKQAHAGQDIVLFSDSIDPAPLVHFTAKYITSNKIEYSDIDFVMNDTSHTLARNPQEFLIINGARVKDIEADGNIFCKNGFIHKVDKVMMPLDNMAEIIRNDKSSKIYSDILERFSSIKYNKALTDRYNTYNNTDVDSVFVKRYFSDRSTGSTVANAAPFKYDLNGRVCDGSLKFDPGWNSYVPAIFNSRNGMMEDLGVMLVPNDKAMDEWWNDGGGKVIKDFYGSLEATPLSTLAQLVNVNMIESFNSAVPSRFNSVLNDANERLNITEGDVDRVTIGCNGLVYHTNKVFAPASYSSVLFPAIVDTTNFNIVNLGIQQLDFDKYLNSMVSTYSFFLPTNKGMALYVDPVSYAAKQKIMWEFRYDQKTKNIHAAVYKCENVDGKWVKGEATGSYVAGKAGAAKGAKGQSKNTGGDPVMADRMEDLLNNCIVVEPLQQGKKYYKTKGNTFVKVEGTIDDEGSMRVYGSGQVETDDPLEVSHIYNMKNGKTYVVDGVIAGSQKTVSGTLAQYDEFSEFNAVLQLSGAVSQKNSKDGWLSVATETGDGNLLNIKTFGDVGAEDFQPNQKGKQKVTYLLNNYHYTVYAPTNEAMQKAYNMGLPSPELIYGLEEQLAAAVDEKNSELADSLEQDIAEKKEALLDFVKYHIQDNSVFMDEGFQNGNYETAKTELIQASDEDGNPSNKFTPGRPYKLYVNTSSSAMTVRDNIGETHNVIPALSNIMAREYWINTTKTQITDPEKEQIANSSFVVIQGIDGPLVYDKEQFVYKYKPIYQEAN